MCCSSRGGSEWDKLRVASLGEVEAKEGSRLGLMIESPAPLSSAVHHTKDPSMHHHNTDFDVCVCGYECVLSYCSINHMQSTYQCHSPEQGL